ncbi:MAG: class I SAM-dependent methyltransferase [Coxiellaceae bacterium]|nr:class I SAM-dependent methyltransferase [Coxiellaceae bacterium]
MTSSNKMPLKDVFNDIYKTNKWLIGSGTGSIPILNSSIIHFINRFINEHTDIETVLDIGCGDFKIGKKLCVENKKYIGVDVSSEIIKHCKNKNFKKNYQFIELDAAHDQLPAADLIILKDVLMHLCFEKIHIILDKINTYKYVIIQNDIYSEDMVNVDIKDGDFRALNVTLSPFEDRGYQLAHTYIEGLQYPGVLLSKFIPFIRGRYKGIFTNT